MIHRNAVVAAVLAAVFVLAAGCQSGKPVPPKGSGFLGDAYPLLLPNPNYANSWRWQKPGVDLGEYDKLILDPVEVRLSKDAEAQSVPPEMTARAAEALTRVLNATIDPYYDVVTQPGPHTLRIRLALSDVMPDTTSPSGGVDIGGAAGEGEMLDSVTGERLVAVMSRIEHSASIETDDVPVKWKGTEGAFHVWGKRLLEFLDRQGVGKER
jgi:hypothetical protein